MPNAVAAPYVAIQEIFTISKPAPTKESKGLDR